MKRYLFISLFMVFALLMGACKEDELQMPPIVSFTMSASEVETQETVYFFGDADVLKPAQVVSWAWNFGENATSVSAEKDPSYVYTTPGVFEVTLTALADNGKSAFLKKTITVAPNANELAHASFTISPSKIMFGDEVTFTSTSIPAVGATITSYRWNLGDNSSEQTTAEVKHTYSTVGKYSVSLTIRDSNGNEDTYSTDVNILDPNEQVSILWDEVLLSVGMIEDTNSPAMSPDGKTVYAWAGEGTTVASKTQLKAFDVATGAIKWTFNVADAASALHANAAISRAYASPSVGANGDIYIAGRDLQAGGAAARRAFVFAVKDNGTLRWAYAMGQDANFVNHTPAIDANGNVYVSYMTTSPYKIRVINGTDGSSVKEFESVASRAGMALSKSGNIYLMSAASPIGLYTYNYTSESQSWTYGNDFRTVHDGSPSIDTDGTIYCLAQGTGYGVVSAVSAAGVEKWQFYTKGATAYGGVVIGEDGTLFVNAGTIDGEYVGGIHALNADGTEKWFFGVDEAVERCVPLVDDRGYVHFITTAGTYYVVTNMGTLFGKKKLGGKVVSSPVMNSEGKLCITTVNDGAVRMICLDSGATGYADSAWPMRGQNPQRTNLQK